MSKFSESIMVALGLSDIPPGAPIPGERRREHRRPVDLAAVCEIIEPYKRYECRVVDISNSGAQLTFNELKELPNTFRLYILELNAILECNLAWHRENNAGVSFTSTAIDV